MTKGNCYAPDCTRQAKHTGLCDPHYRQKRAGKPFRTIRNVNVSAEERFWAKVEKTDTCWNWTAGTRRGGYGSFDLNGVPWTAHRLSYVWAKGPIPEGMYVDHICFNRACVNPDHLRVATNKQNCEHRQGASANNKSSGVRNVYKSGDSWRVVIGHNRQLHRFGSYPTLEEAEQVAIRERARLFTF